MTAPSYADRLGFVLPDFTRVAWVSDRAAAVWRPRVADIAAAWVRVERHSVVEGVRRCFLTRMSQDDMVAAGPRWARHGLSVVALRREGMVDGYRSTPVASGAGDRDGFLVVVGRAADASEFHAAWTVQGHDRMGQLLGYPSCCRRFFTDVWVDERCIDTTWQMAAPGRDPDARSVRVTGPVEANVLWRWMGLRLVPHLPCGFGCPATVALGKALRGVAADIGVGGQAAMLDEILDWPVEWSALHGIAEIKTPICKIVARTDATAGRYAVARDGTRYPAEGADGLGFPYRKRATVLLPMPVRRHRDEERYRDNGFRSLADMTRLHAPIVAAASAYLGDGAGDIADLGCGNGALLQAITALAPGRLRGFGVEIDPAKVQRSVPRLNGSQITLVSGDLFDVDRWAQGREFQLGLLAVRRLSEIPPERVEAFLHALGAYSRGLLLYSYPDGPGHGVRQALDAFGLQADRIDDTLAVVTLQAAADQANPGTGHGYAVPARDLATSDKTD